MGKEFDNEAVWQTVETKQLLVNEFNVAMAIGDYKKPNDLLEVLHSLARKKDKTLDDVMVM